MLAQDSPRLVRRHHKKKDGEEKFFHSNGTVTLAPTQAGKDQFAYDGSQLASGSTTQGVVKPGTPANGSNYYTPYLNQFLNHFSYWTPQRLAMGSQLLDNSDVTKDADKYQPVVKTIDGRTDQTLADLNAKSGIDGLIQQTGVDEAGNPTYAETHDLSFIQNVTWYNSTTDATDWNNLMGGEATPTNPTGNLQTSDKSAWAKVTYGDGSIDFVNIPLHITDHTETLADQYRLFVNRY